jgi:hypothetical protein
MTLTKKFCFYSNGRGLQGEEDDSKKRSLSTIINKERLEILSRQTRMLAQLKIIDKKETTGEAGVCVELILPYQAKQKKRLLPANIFINTTNITVKVLQTAQNCQIFPAQV